MISGSMETMTGRISVRVSGSFVCSVSFDSRGLPGVVASDPRPLPKTPNRAMTLWRACSEGLFVPLDGGIPEAGAGSPPESHCPGRVDSEGATDTEADDQAILNAAIVQLGEYFEGARKGFDLPVALYGTRFETDIWKSMMNVSFGSTVSYSELAAMAGRAGSARATGGACGRNPVPIIVPCHRILGSGGSIGGFGPGTDLKRKLLSLEGIAVPK